MAGDGSCSLESSLLLPSLEHFFSSKLTHMCLGYRVLGMVHINFFPSPVVDIFTCRAGEGGSFIAKFLLPELCW